MSNHKISVKNNSIKGLHIRSTSLEYREKRTSPEHELCSSHTEKWRRSVNPQHCKVEVDSTEYVREKNCKPVAIVVVAVAVVAGAGRIICGYLCCHSNCHWRNNCCCWSKSSYGVSTVAFDELLLDELELDDALLFWAFGGPWMANKSFFSEHF